MNPHEARGAASGCLALRKTRGTRSRFPPTSVIISWKIGILSYGNLVPRDLATREIFNVCVHEGLSVEPDRQCVYLDLTHISRSELDRKLGGILDIYEKFQGVDPRDVPMKICPAVHYSMGGLWADYDRTAEGGLVLGSPRSQLTNVPGIYSIGECDYEYHGANRLALIRC